MKPFVLPVVLLTLALIWITRPVPAQKAETTENGRQTFASGPERVALVEVFTSQGCSSCPPADAWLSKKLKDRELWKKYVPVAWHVDYWDRLGWPDPFATAAHTQRQHAYHRSGKVNSVYTPGFVLNGGEWRGFFARQSLPDATKLSRHHPKNLKATVTGEKVTIEVVEPASPDQDAWDIHLAVLGFGFETKVERGENARRTLSNDFVALDHQQGKLDDLSAAFDLPDLTATGARRHALAVWLTPAGELTPIQATGGWLN